MRGCGGAMVGLAMGPPRPNRAGRATSPARRHVKAGQQGLGAHGATGQGSTADTVSRAGWAAGVLGSCPTAGLGQSRTEPRLAVPQVVPGAGIAAHPSKTSSEMASEVRVSFALTAGCSRGALGML